MIEVAFSKKSIICEKNIYIKGLNHQSFNKL